MVVNPEGVFLTQRENPRLALIQPSLGAESDGLTELQVSTDGLGTLHVPEMPERRMEVQVWGFTGEALDMGDECADWFSTVLDQSCRLVRFPDDVHRPTSRRHTDLESEVAFADGYPALLLSVESLRALNTRLQQPVAMNRFRPNIVVRDTQPFAEDSWRELRAPDLTLSVVKPCERCKITTVDQDSAETGKEPLATLALFRRLDGKVVFGQNCVHHGPGTLKVGDPLQTVGK